MALPDKTAHLTLDYSSYGSPFVGVVAKPSTEAGNLDYSSYGSPLWVVNDEAAPPATGDLLLQMQQYSLTGGCL